MLKSFILAATYYYSIMLTAEIITIGTELLLGEIVDTNAPYIARKLRDVGVNIRRTWSIGDNIEDIAAAIQEATQRAQIIITTGGLGPTVDDPTRDAVARAFGVQTEFRPELWQQVIDRFARFDRTPTENNRKQAYVPAALSPSKILWGLPQRSWWSSPLWRSRRKGSLFPSLGFRGRWNIFWKIMFCPIFTTNLP
ncbi:MAG: competence/damage-inducible protein A [Anaerolineae bacterium]|nr:competence/damage-inducible protein A [Anaerolineae bacterium]